MEESGKSRGRVGEESGKGRRRVGGRVGEESRGGSRKEGEAVQKCKSAYGLCKGAKWNQITECGVQITESKGEPDWRGRSIECGVQITEERVGRGYAAPSYGGGQGEALPLPAGGARERHARAARGAVPTRYKVKRGTGAGRRLVCLLCTPYSGLCNPLPPCFRWGVWSKWPSPLYALGYPLSHHRWTDPRVLRSGPVRQQPLHGEDGLCHRGGGEGGGLDGGPRFRTGGLA